MSCWFLQLLPFYLHGRWFAFTTALKTRRCSQRQHRHSHQQRVSKAFVTDNTSVYMWNHVEYGPHPRNYLDIFTPNLSPSEQSLLPILIFVHGGAWSFGDKHMHGLYGKYFSSKRNADDVPCVLINVNYTLHPKGICHGME